MSCTKQNRGGWLIAATVVLGLCVATGCGPSAAETRRAKTAIYKCDESTVFEAIVSVVKERTGTVASADQSSRMVISDFRWHSSTGVPKSKGAAYVGDGDVAFGYVVKMQRQEPGWFVGAAPRVLTHVVGSPRGQEIGPSNAAWPEWADSKIDVLMVAIYDDLKSKCPGVVNAQ